MSSKIRRTSFACCAKAAALGCGGGIGGGGFVGGAPPAFSDGAAPGRAFAGATGAGATTAAGFEGGAPPTFSDGATPTGALAAVAGAGAAAAGMGVTCGGGGEASCGAAALFVRIPSAESVLSLPSQSHFTLTLPCASTACKTVASYQVPSLYRPSMTVPAVRLARGPGAFGAALGAALGVGCADADADVLAGR